MLYEKANFRCIEPVLDALLHHDFFEPVFVPGFDFKEHSGQITPLVVPERFTCVRLDDMVGPDEQTTLQRRADEIFDALRPTVPANDSTEKVVAGVVRDRLRQPWMPEVLEAYAHHTAALARLAEDFQPKFVVLPEDTDYIRGRLAAQSLRQRGAIVVVLAAWYYNAFTAYPLVGERRADHFLAMTQHFADRLVDVGVDRHHIDVVGNPAFDALADLTRQETGHPIFVYALQNLAWEPEIFADLLAIFDRRREIDLLVRLHPESAAADSHASLDLPPNVHIDSKGTTSQEWMAQAACVIAQSSSALFEAAVVGIPVITPAYDPMPVPIFLPHADRSAVIARTAAELERMIDAVLAGKGRSLNRQLIAPHYPHSTEAVIRSLENLNTR
jgi:hypothetical protein